MREIVEGRPAVRARRGRPRRRRSRSSPTSRTSARSSRRVDPTTSARSARGRSISRLPQPAARRRRRSSTSAAARTCRRTKRLGAFKLTKVAGAYWRGDENAPDAPAHLRHRVGVEGRARGAPAPARGGRAARPPQARRRARPVLVPRGDRLRPRGVPSEGRRSSASSWRTTRAQRHEAAGYEFVNSPHITKSNLFETSGHLDWFADGMFPPMELDEGGDGDVLPQADELPVPHPDLQEPHALVPRAAAAVVRVRHGVPLREVGRRARAHARARHDPGRRAHLLHARSRWSTSSHSLLEFVLDLLRDYGLDDFYLELSTKPEGKAVGTDEEWDEATEALRDGGDGDGPRARDGRGRRRVLRPEDLGAGDATPSAARGRCRRSSSTSSCRSASSIEYVGADNERHRPIMIHRALFGSIERFFAILVEHYAGAFPAWLAPVQVDGAAGRRPARRRTRAALVDRLRGRRLPRRDASTRTPTRSARASAGPSSRRCRTCSSSATTTSSTARSA